jgi:hypothetical protein
MSDEKIINLGRVASFFARARSGGNTLNTNFSDIDGYLSKYQNSIMSANDIRNILGANFEQNYRRFEETYFETISDSRNLRKGVKSDVELLRAQRRIDLSLLNYTEQQRLHKMYLEEVLQKNQLFAQAGLPGIIMPSANPTRMSMKYMIDNSNIEDPSQILFNRLTFSIDPFTGSVSLPKSNIPMFDALTSSMDQRELFNTMSLQGKRIGIFDVETTGVYRGAQIRSMAIAEMQDGVTSILSNVAFESDQLRGFSIRYMNSGIEEYINFNTLISRVENTDLKKMGAGGVGFLDEATQYINQLLTFDAISAHNAKFDIDMLTSTMTSMPGFAKHEEARKAISSLYSRINDSTKGPFLIDTLDIARSYLHKQAVDLAQMQGVYSTGLDFGEQVVKNLFDPKILARTQTGGSASYASVEAIAMNTNLTELIYKNNPVLFDNLGGQAHQASYDTLLQSEIHKYMSEGQLKIRGLEDFGTYDSDILSSARQLRQQIFRSSAIVSNLNIQDINMISDLTYNYVMRDPLSAGVVVEGFERGQLISPVGESLSDILVAARNGIPAAQERVLSLGVNFFQESATNEISNLISQQGSISREITDQTILDAFTITESKFGAKTSGMFLSRQNRGFSFTQGFSREMDIDDSIGISRAFSTIGSPFDFLDVRSRMISASIAEATESNAARIYQDIMSMGEGQDLLERFKFTSYAKQMSSEGISYFDANAAVRVFDDASRFSKVQLPFEVAQKAYEETIAPGSGVKGFSSLSLSVNSRDQVNLVWNIGRQASQQEVDNFTMSIFNMLDSSNNNPSSARLFADLDISNEVAAIARMRNSQNQTATTIMQSEAFQRASEMIKERGIVIGSLGDEISENLIRTLGAQNIPIGALEQDTVIGQWTARLLDQFNGHLIVGPFVNETAARVNNVKYEGQKAIEYLNEIAEYISDSPGLSERILKERKMALFTEDVTSFARMYENIKPQMKIGALGISAALVGYYAAGKVRERSIINETMEIQPREIPGYRNQMQTVQNYRVDPLLTAGVVGSLDANKTSHFRMGPDKYSHLFGV